MLRHLCSPNNVAKTMIKEIAANAQEQEKQRPSLLAPDVECPPVERQEYKPGQRIEMICSLPGV